MESAIATKGEEIYELNKAELEKAFLGRIVAIETESGTIAGIGSSLDEAYEEALKKYPGKRFYFRKVGPCSAPTHLFEVGWRPHEDRLQGQLAGTETQD